jgi:hypothetical protein
MKVTSAAPAPRTANNHDLSWAVDGIRTAPRSLGRFVPNTVTGTNRWVLPVAVVPSPDGRIVILPVNPERLGIDDEED